MTSTGRADHVFPTTAISVDVKLPLDGGGVVVGEKVQVLLTLPTRWTRPGRAGRPVSTSDTPEAPRHVPSSSRTVEYARQHDRG
jgi:hypothetical protein